MEAVGVDLALSFAGLSAYFNSRRLDFSTLHSSKRASECLGNPAPEIWT
jgi:hypothetical protein